MLISLFRNATAGSCVSEDNKCVRRKSLSWACIPKQRPWATRSFKTKLRNCGWIWCRCCSQKCPWELLNWSKALVQNCHRAVKRRQGSSEAVSSRILSIRRPRVFSTKSWGPMSIIQTQKVQHAGASSCTQWAIAETGNQWQTSKVAELNLGLAELPQAQEVLVQCLTKIWKMVAWSCATGPPAHVHLARDEAGVLFGVYHV